MNPYQVLGISSTATNAEIKRAYRALSLQYHPDRNQSEEAKQKIQEINAAYEVLGDEEKRRQYDLSGQIEGQGGGARDFQFHFHGPMGAGMGMDGVHFFEQFFGGPGGPGQGGPFEHILKRFMVPQKPQPIEKIIEITLDQVFEGVAKMEIPIERTKTVFDPSSAMGNRNYVHEESKEIFTLLVDIPRGIQSNEMLMISEEGNQWLSHPQTANPKPPVKGDIVLRLTVKNHADYTRRNMDMVYKKKLGLKEALCGTRFQLPPIGTRSLMVCQCDVVVHPGLVKVCPGLGFSNATKEVVGNLVVEFEVEFPTSIDEETKTKIAALPL